MSEEIGEGVIRYTTKELLSEIREGIASIKTLADQHDRRISELERWRTELDKDSERDAATIRELAEAARIRQVQERDRKRGWSYKAKIIGLAVVIAGVVFQAIATIHGL